MIRHKDYLLVQVPETAYSFQVLESELDFCTKDLEADAPIDLPPGTWQLIGLAAELTEGQLTEVGWENVPGKLLKTTTVILKQIQ